MTPPIAILGAGPSGLLLARLLEVASIDYIIFERDASSENSTGSGGTLDIHSNSGQLALQEAGLLEKFKKLARYDASSKFANYEGKVLAEFGADGNVDRPEMDRKDLRALILESVPAEKIKWGMRVEEIVKEANGSMAVHFADGSFQSSFKLVVGADGAWSKAKKSVTSAKPEYSGFHYITSHMRPDNPHYSSAVKLAGRGNYMAFGNCQQLSAMFLSDGSYHVGLGLRLPEDWSDTHPLSARRTMMQELCAGWPEMETNVIVNSDDDFRAWPLYAMPTESLSWESVPGVTLIGDAAHVTTPFEGEGVNCALQDSAQLARKIREYGLGNLDQAVREYEQDMFDRGIDLISRSAESGELLFASDAPTRWLQKMGIECG
ncbi:related to tetracycline resistance protein from transposon Tn4351/Tn4400 [Ramularia collo-cygni]|uniref:Related to tetracycline resistance protein from transposon Tn4351/Tn4400 n=1 Tax=Ramularia collo-cygni TaxID=112498 RepID=A0A2D3UTR5_9PEZI|nr:related to tetracycline resistance protein from transposon Tn4351/Tn4400 [Ramularia collo-cygni]CZT19871.1 related to tetracycline resistance protein from transposon Tn4351/Tn4400 [Ramularia collo-cygni]